MSSPFEHLFDISPFPAVITRLRDNSVIAVNRHTSEIYGISQADSVGLITTDYYVDLSQRERLMAPLEATGKADAVLLHLRKPDGETFWARVSARLITWDDEPAVLTVFEDVSDQLTAQRALAESQQRLAAQSRALTFMTATHANPVDSFTDRLHGILKAAAETLRVERVSLWQLDEPWTRISCIDVFTLSTRRHESGATLLREDAPAYFAALERERIVDASDARTDPRTREFLHLYLRPLDIYAMLDVPLRRGNEVSGVLCVEHAGSPRTWTIDEQNFALAAANLISVAIADERRREALAQVVQSDARARLILDTAHDAFIGMDGSSRIVQWNAQAEHIFGWTSDEAIGRSLAETIIPPQFREAHLRGMERFLETGKAPVVNRRLELSALHRSGREFPIEITITAPMRRDDDYFFGAFLRDISDRIERDEALRHAKEAAEAATRAKSEFFANMSHELRTPLNGVIGYGQLLQRDRTLNVQQREAVDAIAKCGANLLELINDVLDLSKIEAGRLDIEQSATELAQLVTDLQYVIAESAARKALTLTLTVDPNLPARVVLDGRHVRQILLNLLGNAIKFTAQGAVSLTISADGGSILFEVSDTGPGIAPEDLERIFDAFTQTPAGAAAGGTGLGLTISRNLLEMMGTELRVDSRVGHGSRFHFTLPLVPATDDLGDIVDARPSLFARLAPGQDVTALVADDNTVSRRILAGLLESAGLRVLTATGGFETIFMAQQHRPDVILVDVKMPDLDGFAAARLLSEDALTRGIPVIAVSASPHGHTRKGAKDAGCVAYLPKPIRAEALFAALATHLMLKFVWEAKPGSPQVEVTVEKRHASLAPRLRDATAIGAVSDLHALADALTAGDDVDAALGRRISTLAANFDFDAIRELAASLDREA